MGLKPSIHQNINLESCLEAYRYTHRYFRSMTPRSLVANRADVLGLNYAHALTRPFSGLDAPN